MTNPPNQSPKNDKKYYLHIVVCIFEGENYLSTGSNICELAKPEDTEIYKDVAWQKGELSFASAFGLALLKLLLPLKEETKS